MVKEIKPTQRESNGILTSTSMTGMAGAAAEGPPNLSHSNSVSDDHLGDKDVSSSTPSDGVGSLARVSPPNTSICNTSTSDNDNILENNGFCSPDVLLQPAKFKNTGKWSSKAEAATALASFQAVIRTLTRTKESIGRATRIAIDCAKFAVAPKVCSCFCGSQVPMLLEEWRHCLPIRVVHCSVLSDLSLIYQPNASFVGFYIDLPTECNGLGSLFQPKKNLSADVIEFTKSKPFRLKGEYQALK